MKRLSLIFIILSILLTTGCWDMVEINDRIYPYSIGYDLNPTGNGKYTVTYSYPNIGALGKNATSEEKVYVISTTGDNAYDAMGKLTSRSSKPFYLKHLKVVVLSEEVARNEKLVREIVDGIERDYITNKNVQMVVVKDNAQSFLDIVVNAEKQYRIEGSLYGMLINEQNSSLFSPITLTRFIEEMDLSGSSIVPLATHSKDEIILSGGAIYKGYQLIGYLSPKEIRSIKYLRDMMKVDDLDINYKGDELSLVITNSKTKLSLIDKEHIKLRFDVELEGYINNYTKNENKEIVDENVLIDMQETIDQNMERELYESIKIIQKEYEIDALFIGDYIRKYYTKIWKEIEKEWTEIYPDIDIEVDVKAFIRRKGITR